MTEHHLPQQVGAYELRWVNYHVTAAQWKVFGPGLNAYGWTYDVEKGAGHLALLSFAQAFHSIYEHAKSEARRDIRRALGIRDFGGELKLGSDEL